VCRFLFMEPVALTRQDSHNLWTSFWGAFHRGIQSQEEEHDPKSQHGIHGTS